MSDHQVFVGLDDKGRDATGPVTLIRAWCCRVGRLVEFQAEPGAAAADLAADRRGIFADAGSEYDAVETTEGSGERGDLPRYS